MVEPGELAHSHANVLIENAAPYQRRKADTDNKPHKRDTELVLA